MTNYIMQANKSISAGDSAEQREAEEYLINSFSEELKTKLEKRRFSIHDRGWLEIDGVSDSPLILCEAWAHIGLAKSAQKHKVLTDATKLLFTKEFLIKNKSRCILLFCDMQAASHFKGYSWMAQYLKSKEIEIKVIVLPKHIRDKVVNAQKRQHR